MPERVIMYGTPVCGGCTRAKRILESHNISYEYIDLSKTPSASEKVIEYNKMIGKGPFRSVPLIIIDGKILSEPSDQALIDALK